MIVVIASTQPLLSAHAFPHRNPHDALFTPPHRTLSRPARAALCCLEYPVTK